MKLSKLTSLILPVLLLQACGSSDSDLQSTDQPEARRPTSSIEIDVVRDNIVAAQVAPQAAAATANLFTNPGFENGISGWTECQPGAISASDNAYAGSGALEIQPDNCFFRSVTVSPGDEYALSCFIKLTEERAWTGMGMAFSRSNFETLREAPVAVATSGNYARLETTGTAPAGTSFLSMWIHSDHGALVDSCSLTLSGNADEVAPIAAENLLSNSDFAIADDQGGAADWLAGCGGSVVSDGSSLFLSDGACADQALSPEAVGGIENGEATFSCLVTEVNGYSDLSVFFDDTLQGVQVIQPEDKNKVVELTVAAGQIGNGFVSLYSDGNLQVENCQLIPDSSNAGVTIVPNTNTDPDTEATTDTSARYRLTFNATWSAQSHPLNFPPPAHFSGLAGAVHNNSVSFWGPGQLATDGVKLMAETGDASLLLTEVAATVANGSAASEISGGNVPASPGSVSIEFEVTRDHPLITVSSMVAPSPDWFVGVHGLSLFDGTDFVESMTLDLSVYDAGTDSGARYTSADLVTAPASPIGLLTSDPADAPFLNGTPGLGQFVIQRLP